MRVATVVLGILGILADGAYWTMFGVDQFVHQLTYVGFLALLSGAFGHVL